jgi:hypothetical protein
MKEGLSVNPLVINMLEKPELEQLATGSESNAYTSLSTMAMSWPYAMLAMFGWHHFCRDRYGTLISDCGEERSTPINSYRL